MTAETDRPRLPKGITACLFDLDGVLTKTATVHAAAWQEMFDEYLRARAERTGAKFVPFDPVADYDAYVDGLPRADGTRAFLRSRNIDLPAGGPDDPPDAETVHALSERKNQLVLHKIEHDGVEVYPGSVRFLRAVRAAGMPVAVVSSSANCAQVLASTGLDRYVDTRIDGIVAEREHLAGKPAPDTYLAGAKALGVPPSTAAVFEDALAGVASGRAGNFGCVVGVDRVGQADELRHHGADTVVTDLAELLVTE
ncbi:MAG TPA: beta-phosphoglucomutase family hydrolase [Pseudonocardiaceae bacterium]